MVCSGGRNKLRSCPPEDVLPLRPVNTVSKSVQAPFSVHGQNTVCFFLLSVPRRDLQVLFYCPPHRRSPTVPPMQAHCLRIRSLNTTSDSPLVPLLVLLLRRHRVCSATENITNIIALRLYPPSTRRRVHRTWCPNFSHNGLRFSGRRVKGLPNTSAAKRWLIRQTNCAPSKEGDIFAAASCQEAD